VIGIPVTLPELVAAIPGTLPTIKGGLLTTTVDAWVVTEETELDLAGELGRPLGNDTVDVGGDGAVKELAEFRCWWP